MSGRATIGARDRIIGVREDRGRRRYVLDRRRRACVIGTGADADIRLTDPHVSGHHCALVWSDAGELLVVDRDSRNGTWIDGVRCERAYLADGARLVVGTTALIAFSERSRSWRSPRERGALAAAMARALRPRATRPSGLRGIGTTLIEALRGASRR